MLRSTAILTTVLLAASVAFAQPADSPDYDTPLGIGLETWPYPHPVHYLPLTIDRQQLRMAYMDVAPDGVADAPVVVLFHGKNFWGGYWRDTIAALTDAGFRVVVPDQIGFGKSSKPDIHYSFDLLAANTARLLDHLEIEQTAVVGHSMGGMVATRFALNYPGRTTQLVLANPIGLEDYRLEGVPAQPLETLIESELQTTADSVRTYFRNAYFKGNWEARYETLVEPHARVTLSGEYPRWARAAALTYQMIYQQPLRHEFGRIDVPTLLIIGQDDRTALGKNLVDKDRAAALGNYPELGRAAAEDIPDAKLVELDGIGHIPHIQAPDRFHPPLLEFLK